MKLLTSIFALFPFAVVTAGFYLYCIGAHFIGVGGPVYSGSFRLLMDVLAFVGLWLVKNNFPLRKNGFFEILLIVFAVLCFLNWYFVSSQSGYGLKKLGFLFIIALFPFYLTKFISSVINHKKFISLVAYLSLFLSIASIVVYACGGSFEIARGRFTIVEGWNTIPSALVSGVSIIWVCWLIFWGKKSFVRYSLLLIVSVLALYSMYLTGSRGPVLSLFLAMVLSPPMRISLVSMKKITVVVILAVIFLAAIVFGPNEMARKRFDSLLSKDRITDTGRLDTIGQRENRYVNAFNTGYDNIMFGRGLGTTPERHYAHNSFLEIWEELGLSGATLYLLIFGGCMFLICRRRVRYGRYINIAADDTSIWFWETVFFYSFFEGLVSLTIFSNSLLWVSMGMVVMCHRGDSD